MELDYVEALSRRSMTLIVLLKISTIIRLRREVDQEQGIVEKRDDERDHEPSESGPDEETNGENDQGEDGSREAGQTEDEDEESEDEGSKDGRAEALRNKDAITLSSSAKRLRNIEEKVQYNAQHHFSLDRPPERGYTQGSLTGRSLTSRETRSTRWAAVSFEGSAVSLGDEATTMTSTPTLTASTLKLSTTEGTSLASTTDPTVESGDSWEPTLPPDQKSSKKSSKSVRFAGLPSV